MTMKHLVVLISFCALSASLVPLAAAPTEDEVDAAIRRGLDYLQAAQESDGAFGGGYGKTTALPALAAMACLATGHVPGDKRYGDMIDKALDYILAHHDESGYFGHAQNVKMYAHAISTLFLTEVSGMVSKERQAEIDAILPKAVKVILDAQNVKKFGKDNIGGWRYQPNSHDSDTSCSGWCLMALRSARHNGAPVPPEAINRAVEYIHRFHNREIGSFGYTHPSVPSVTLSGAGILCLELCGRHEDPDSMRAAKYLMGMYRDPDKGMVKQDHQSYGLYYASQGLFQIGGENWKEFSAWMYETFLAKQKDDGSWPHDRAVPSPVYTTAMTILAFAVPYRQLPVYQRDETVDE